VIGSVKSPSDRRIEAKFVENVQLSETWSGGPYAGRDVENKYMLKVATQTSNQGIDSTALERANIQCL